MQDRVRDRKLEREKKLARGAGDKEWEQENEPAKEPWVHSETLDSVM